MNELREKIRTILVNHSDNKRANDKIENDIFELIQSQPINKELDSFTVNKPNKFSYQVMKLQDKKIKELEKENESLKFKLKRQEEKYQSASNQIAQLQKKIELYEELLKESSEYLLDFVDGLAGELCQYQNLKDRIEESLTNNPDESPSN